tara:strand:+ start:186 stop:320 length:135 start_codon:yes stop_codon:yes gene_type:complete
VLLKATPDKRASLAGIMSIEAAFEKYYWKFSQRCRAVSRHKKGP